jgi:hypothetical protein
VEPTIGLRADYLIIPVVRVDPRVNVTIDWGARGRVRAAGSLDQAPIAPLLRSGACAIRLAPMAATHYLAGWGHVAAARRGGLSTPRNTRKDAAIFP